MSLDPHAGVIAEDDDDGDDDDDEGETEDLGAQPQTPASEGTKVEVGEDGQQTLKFNPEDMTYGGGAQTPTEPVENGEAADDEHEHDEL